MPALLIILFAILYSLLGGLTYIYYVEEVKCNKSKTVYYEDYAVQIVLLHPIFVAVALYKTIKKECIKTVEFTVKMLNIEERKKKSERTSKASED